MIIGHEYLKHKKEIINKKKQVILSKSSFRVRYVEILLAVTSIAIAYSVSHIDFTLSWQTLVN